MAETHKYCVDTGSKISSVCFEKKESAIEYAKAVSRMEGKRVRVLTLAGARRRRRRRR